MQKTNWKTAQEYLKKTDAIMADLISKYGDCPLNPDENFFTSLCNAIISQQLAAKAADAICYRFKNHYDSDLTPKEVQDTSFDVLRSIGLSKQKITYIWDLAEKTLNGRLTPDNFMNMSDEDIIQQLTAVKGIGLWTSQIFLLFALNRQDVFPADDLGLRKALQKLLQLNELPDKKTAETLSLRWSPYRSLASWYLWRSLENKSMD